MTEPNPDECIRRLLDYLDGKKRAEDWWNQQRQTPPPHGDLVEVRQEAYCDWYVYEDGHEEHTYIGD